MPSLMDTLVAKQAELGLSDTDFAAKLGISRPLWSMIRDGKRKPGQKVVAGVMRAFPRLTDDALTYLRDKPFSLAQNVTAGDEITVTAVAEIA